MRRPRPRSLADLDAVDVLLVEDDEQDVAADEVRTVLHELALEAMAWRATWPGESRPMPDAEADATVRGPAPAGWARRVARRYRRRAVSAAMLAVAVAATTAVVDARQTAARAAALAAAPAVLAEAPGAPAELWRVPGRVVGDGDDNLLVVADASLRSLDPATGEVIWTASAAAGRAAAAGDCFPVDERLRPGRAPVDADAGPRGLLACVADTSRETSPERDATGGLIVVVDSTTGGTRHTVAVDGALLLAEPVGRDLLVADALPDDRVRVTRWDLANGTPRWDSVSPQPAVTGGRDDGVERRPDSLTVGTFAVDLASGAELAADVESGGPYPYEQHALPGGARATWSWHTDGTSGQGRVSDGSAGRSYWLPGPPLRPSLSDGSDGRVLVIRTARGDQVRGLDMRSGRMRWTRPYPGASGLRATALVDGVMLLDDGTTVTALDVGTGDDLWRAHVESEATDGPALTDGRVVLLPVTGDDGALDLVAHRITDGTVLGRIPAPAGTVSVTVVDHRLVASTDDEVVGLG